MDELPCLFWPLVGFMVFVCIAEAMAFVRIGRLERELEDLRKSAGK